MEETKKEFTPRPERAERPQRGRRRRKVCAFCVDKIEHVDYKDAARLRKYMSERGKILPLSLIHIYAYTIHIRWNGRVCRR